MNELGRLIAESRAEHGLSQEHLASLLAADSGSPTVTRHEVSRWERGQRLPSVFWRKSIANVLGIDITFLEGLAFRSRGQNRSQKESEASDFGSVVNVAGIDNEYHGSTFWRPGQTVRDLREFVINDLTLDRRTIVGGLATLAIGTRLTEPIDGWAAGIPLYHSANRERGLSEEEVRHIELTSRALRTWDSRFRLGIRRKALLGQLAEVAELIELGQPAELERRLFRVIAELGKVAASMSWDVGLDAEAQRYYFLALRASQAAQDRMFALSVLAAMARQMIYLDRSGDALEIVRAAMDGVPDAPPRVLAMLRLREAWAHARSGRMEAFRRVADKSGELLAISPAPAAGEPYWIDGFDQAEFLGTIGGRYLELATIRRSRQAYIDGGSHIEQALQLRSERRVKNRALDYVNLARARLGLGEPVEAAALAAKGLELAHRIKSGHVDRKIVRFAKECAPYAANIDVRQTLNEVKDYLRRRSIKSITGAS